MLYLFRQIAKGRTKVPAKGDNMPPRRAKADDIPIPTFLEQSTVNAN